MSEQSLALAMLATLRFYADQENYRSVAVVNDEGERARAVLDEFKKAGVIDGE